MAAWDLDHHVFVSGGTGQPKDVAMKRRIGIPLAEVVDRVLGVAGLGVRARIRRLETGGLLREAEEQCPAAAIGERQELAHEVRRDVPLTEIKPVLDLNSQRFAWMIEQLDQEPL